MPQFHCFCTAWQVDVELGFDKGEDGPSVVSASKLLSVVKSVKTSMSSAIATVDGALPAPGAPVNSLPAAGTIARPHTVDVSGLFLLPC